MGDDANPGSAAAPWATLGHAVAAVPDEGLTVCFEAGVYRGTQGLKRRFTTPTTFRSVEGYRAVLESDGPVIDVDGARNIVLGGFELRQRGPHATGNVVNVDQRDFDGSWAEHITLRDNILHDAYGDDLLKVHNGVRFATVEGNVFYNQADGEQHVEVNSATDVVIQDNIFFNDLAASGRDETSGGKHFIVVKDSNGADDGLTGSKRVRIRRNVLLNWEGIPGHGFMKLGGDRMSYHEAEDVVVENNLLLGNATALADAAFGMQGVRNVRFLNNTVVGDLPAKSYAYHIHAGENPPNRDITFSNNIWSDPTGTMGAEGEGVAARLAKNNPTEVARLVHDHNLFWNAGEPIPPGRQTSPHVDDPFRVVADPGLAVDHAEIELPYWNGDRFRSGNTTVREEFLRLVYAHAALPSDSPAVDAANPAHAPREDILNRARLMPDIGAYEADWVLEEPAVGEDATGSDLVALLGVPAIVLALIPGLLAGRRGARQEAKAWRPRRFGGRRG